MLTTAQLADLLRKLHVEQDEHMRRAQNRSVPFADGMFDRWERASRLGFGEGTSIYNSAVVIGDVQVGKHTWIGPNVILEGQFGSIKIGDYCSISAGTTIYSHDSVKWSLSGGRMDKRTGSVMIGDNCYIGSQTIIGPDVHIGDQSVVATNSFVNENAPPRSIVGGCPAKKLGHVEYIDDEPQLIFDRER